MNKHKQNPSRGFTIVELLIVIVVIGILAAISIVAYNGISQRAKNTAIINAASQSLKMINAYIAETGEYPVAAGTTICITTESGCQMNSGSDDVVSGSTVFDSRMSTVGSLPKDVPVIGGRLYGVMYNYTGLRMINGSESQPLFIIYYLIGKNQACGLSGVVQQDGPNNYKPSSTGYSAYNSSLDKTTCYISVPGPAHS